MFDYPVSVRELVAIILYVNIWGVAIGAVGYVTIKNLYLWYKDK